MRWLVLSYGLAAYLFGIRSLVYFVLFASNIPLVKTVDTGQHGIWLDAFFVDLALLLFFALTDSLIARESFKRGYVRWFPEATLRSTYVLVAASGLTLLMWQWRPIEVVVWEVDHPTGAYAMVGVALMGWILAAIAYYAIGHLELFGLRQTYRQFQGRPPGDPVLITTGVYRYLRNPMYVGFVLGMWSTPRMTAGHLLLSAVMTLYILVGLRYERRDLIAKFGDRYLEYVRGPAPRTDPV